MPDLYQIPLDMPHGDKDYLRWEKLNFILRMIFEPLTNIDGHIAPLVYKNDLSMSGYQVSNGPSQIEIGSSDYVTKSYFLSTEFGRMVVALLAATGKTPLPITGLPGTPVSGGGGGVSDHALLTNLAYATALHTGFVPAVRTISTTAPLTGGGDLSANRTIAIPKATAAVDGYLSAADWTIFNAKQSTLTLGNLTELTSAVLTIAGGTGAVVGAGTSILVKLATGAQSGYLSSGDWTTFNAKVGGSGTVGTLPKFTGVSTLGDSIIKEAAGKVGVGTTGAPAYKLEVEGQIKATLGSILPAVKVLVDAATIATDASLGNHFRVTIGGNRTLGNPSNAVDGQRILWEITQDATGNRLLTLDSKFVIPSNIPDVILSLGAGKTDAIGVVYNAVLDKFVTTGFIKEYT